MGALDPVGAFELLHYQLGIGQDLDPGGPVLPGHLQSHNQGLVLRHVVGGFPQIPAQLSFESAPGVVKQGPGAGRAGVAPGGAVTIKPPEAGLPAAVGFRYLLKEILEFLAGDPKFFQDLVERRTPGQGLENRGPGKLLLPAQDAPWERPSSEASSCQ